MTRTHAYTVTVNCPYCNEPVAIRARYPVPECQCGACGAWFRGVMAPPGSGDASAVYKPPRRKGMWMYWVVVGLCLMLFLLLVSIADYRIREEEKAEGVSEKLSVPTRLTPALSTPERW